MSESHFNTYVCLKRPRKSCLLDFDVQFRGNWFEFDLGLVSFAMIFKTLKYEVLRFKFHSLSSKIPEFNLDMLKFNKSGSLKSL